MNWDAIASVEEIVGASAVVVTLLFLAFETRNNTKVQRASLSNEALGATAALQDLFLTEPDLRSTISCAMRPNASATDFDEKDWELVIYFGRAMFMRLEGMYMLHKQGLIDEQLWKSRLAIAAGVIQIPVWQTYWQEEQKGAIYTPEFVDLVNTFPQKRYHQPERDGSA